MIIMPMLKEIMITAEISAENVKMLAVNIDESGCVSIKHESVKTGLDPVFVRGIYQGMAGVSCDSNKCCVSDATAFAAVLKKLVGDH